MLRLVAIDGKPTLDVAEGTCPNPAEQAVGDDASPATWAGARGREASGIGADLVDRLAIGTGFDIALVQFQLLPAEHSSDPSVSLIDQDLIAADAVAGSSICPDAAPFDAQSAGAGSILDVDPMLWQPLQP